MLHVPGGSHACRRAAAAALLHQTETPQTPKSHTLTTLSTDDQGKFFDPEALERGAKALREIQASPYAKKARAGGCGAAAAACLPTCACARSMHACGRLAG